MRIRFEEQKPILCCDRQSHTSNFRTDAIYRVCTDFRLPTSKKRVARR
ncbi:hypothetical protein HC931_22480 [Candidatus Gracilibacteria bacterium]|nr:hypothetical protein [Candidatus Gracilibacteria bacterium]NJM89323.1 hypothetical protein [Hydrococcus sp. RU_2_2]